MWWAQVGIEPHAARDRGYNPATVPTILTCKARKGAAYLAECESADCGRVAGIGARAAWKRRNPHLAGFLWSVRPVCEIMHNGT